MSYLWHGVGIGGLRKERIIKSALVIFFLLTLFYAWKHDADEEYNDLEQDRLRAISETS